MNRRDWLFLILGTIITIFPIGIADLFTETIRENWVFMFGATWGIFYVGIMERLEKIRKLEDSKT